MAMLYLQNRALKIKSETNQTQDNKEIGFPDVQGLCKKSVLPPLTKSDGPPQEPLSCTPLASGFCYLFLFRTNTVNCIVIIIHYR